MKASSVVAGHSLLPTTHIIHTLRWLTVDTSITTSPAQSCSAAALTRYRIARNFCWCKFSHIWPKSPQNKFSYILISHARATRSHPYSSPMAYSTAWCSRSRFRSLLSFCFDCTTDQESLGRLFKDMAQL